MVSLLYGSARAATKRWRDANRVWSCGVVGKAKGCLAVQNHWSNMHPPRSYYQIYRVDHKGTQEQMVAEVEGLHEAEKLSKPNRSWIEEYDCIVPPVDVTMPEPGTETVRLNRKKYKLQTGGSQRKVVNEPHAPRSDSFTAINSNWLQAWAAPSAQRLSEPKQNGLPLRGRLR